MHVDVPGARIAVERRGAGEPVLMIQGVGVAGQAWHSQVRELGDRYDCLVFDNRGVGTSTGSVGRVSIGQLAADAIAVLDAAGVERAHVIGHSMGGVVAQRLALEHPQRVGSLALLCTFSRGREAVLPRWAMLRHGVGTMVGSAAGRSRRMARLVSSPRDIETLGVDEVVHRLSDAFGRPLGRRPPVAAQQLRALGRHDDTARLGSLRTIRSLVLSGADDLIAPPGFGRVLAAAIDADTYLELPNAGHAVTILQPGIVNAALRAHLEQAGG